MRCLKKHLLTYLLTYLFIYKKIIGPLSVKALIWKKNGKWPLSVIIIIK